MDEMIDPYCPACGGHGCPACDQRGRVSVELAEKLDSLAHARVFKGAWDPVKHPRLPAGKAGGGRFTTLGSAIKKLGTSAKKVSSFGTGKTENFKPLDKVADRDGYRYHIGSADAHDTIETLDGPLPKGHLVAVREGSSYGQLVVKNPADLVHADTAAAPPVRDMVPKRTTELDMPRTPYFQGDSPIGRID